MSLHHLKTWTAPFAEIWALNKTYEVKLLKMHLASPPGHTGREVWVRITYLTRGGDWGLPKGLCVFGFHVMARISASGQDVTP